MRIESKPTLVAAVAVLLVGSPPRVAQDPAPPRPNFAGTWEPADPARSDAYFNVGLSHIPGRGRLAIEQTATRLTMTITMPDEVLDRILTISGSFAPTIIYRVFDSGRAGGAGAGPQLPSVTSWVGDRLVIPNARPGSARRLTSTLSMEGERLKMETRVEIDALRANNVTELFVKVK